MKKQEKQKKAYIYTRVSTEMQIEGYSLEAQEDTLKKYADTFNLKIIREFSDEGKSGKSVENRPDFQRMMKYIESGEDVDFVLVFKLSRFGRNAADVLTHLQKMQDYGVNLICVQDGIDSSKDSGKLVITVLAAVAEIERENIRVQTMAGRIQKARQGLWNGGQAPYGYKTLDGRLIVLPEEADTIKMIYDMYLNQNKGLAFIAHELTDKGYRKPLYKNAKLREFTPGFVKGVLDNPVYMGKIAYGRRKFERIEGTREYHMVKQKDYDIYEGVHEAIIPEDIWERVHEKRQKTGVPNQKKYSLDHVHVLSGLIKCPVCGAGMYGNVNRKKKKDGSGEYYKDEFYYCCKHRKLVDDKRCDYHKQWGQKRVDTEVYEAVRHALDNDEFVNSVKEAMDAEVDSSKHEKELEGLKASKAQTNAAIKKLSEQMDSLDYQDKMYDRKYDDLEKRQNALYERLRVIEENIRRTDYKIQSIIHKKASAKDALMKITNYFMSWSKISDQEKREFFRYYIEEIEIFPEANKHERLVKRIKFKFSVPIQGEGDGAEVKMPDGSYRFDVREVLGYTDEFRWDKDGHVETVCLLTHS